VFVDSTASCDDANHQVTLMLCASPFGALLLGLIITDSQTKKSFQTGFGLLKEIIDEQLGDNAFGGRGYPKIVMTDDCQEERDALKDTWKEIITLLCTFHVPQAIWRWLWDSRNKIDHENRKDLMQAVRALMYSVTETELNINHSKLIEISKSYPQFQKYFEKEYWVRRELWCHFFRNFAELRGNNTNNYAEATMRILKDIVFSRRKCFNGVAMLDTLVTVLTKYYKRRLMDFSCGRRLSTDNLIQGLLKKGRLIPKTSLIANNDSTYSVQSQKMDNTFYTVDPVCGICSCPQGLTGRLCKHQISIFLNLSINLPNMPKMNQDTRRTASWLINGKNMLEASFYQSHMEQENHAIDNILIDDEPMTTHDATETSHDITMEIEDDADSETEEQFESIISKLRQGFHKHRGERDLKIGLKRMSKRVDIAISNPSAFSQFIFNAGGHNNKSRGGRGMIGTQPASRARRREGLTRGLAVCPSGRPAKTVLHKSVPKRKHNFSHSVRSNHPNAKSHGNGH
jgi:hypothetical protein